MGLASNAITRVNILLQLVSSINHVSHGCHGCLSVCECSNYGPNCTNCFGAMAMHVTSAHRTAVPGSSSSGTTFSLLFHFISNTNTTCTHDTHDAGRVLNGYRVSDQLVLTMAIVYDTWVSSLAVHRSACTVTLALWSCLHFFRSLYMIVSKYGKDATY